MENMKLENKLYRVLVKEIWEGYHPVYSQAEEPGKNVLSVYIIPGYELGGRVINYSLEYYESEYKCVSQGLKAADGWWIPPHYEWEISNHHQKRSGKYYYTEEEILDKFKNISFEIID